MGLLDNLTPVTKIDPCKVGRLLIELDKSDSDTLAAALVDTRWTAFALAKALNDRGIPITPDTLRAHIRGICRCSRI